MINWSYSRHGIECMHALDNSLVNNLLRKQFDIVQAKCILTYDATSSRLLL